MPICSSHFSITPPHLFPASLCHHVNWFLSLHFFLPASLHLLLHSTHFILQSFTFLFLPAHLLILPVLFQEKTDAQHALAKSVLAFILHSLPTFFFFFCQLTFSAFFSLLLLISPLLVLYFLLRFKVKSTCQPNVYNGCRLFICISFHH